MNALLWLYLSYSFFIRLVLLPRMAAQRLFRLYSQLPVTSCRIEFQFLVGFLSI